MPEINKFYLGRLQNEKKTFGILKIKNGSRLAFADRRLSGAKANLKKFSVSSCKKNAATNVVSLTRTQTDNIEDNTNTETGLPDEKWVSTVPRC